MMCDFLPAQLHEALNDFETGLSLPFLLVIFLCTVQFVVCHTFHVAYAIIEVLTGNKNRRKACQPTTLADRFKAICTACCNKNKRRPTGKCSKPKKKCGRRAHARLAMDQPSDDGWDEVDEDFPDVFADL